MKYKKYNFLLTRQWEKTNIVGQSWSSVLWLTRPEPLHHDDDDDDSAIHVLYMVLTEGIT